MKKICLDFDGVIHSYNSGWQGTDVIPDKIVPGSLKFIKELKEHFQVLIFSHRSTQPGGIDAIKRWMENAAWEKFGDGLYVGEFSYQLEYPSERPDVFTISKNFLAHTSKCFPFTGKYPNVKILLEIVP